MKLFLLIRSTSTAFNRQIWRNIENFPPIILFILLSLLIVLTGLYYSYGLIFNILKTLPVGLSQITVERLICVVQLLSFLTIYLLLPLTTEPQEKTATLVASPIFYGIIWLGLNSIFITLTIIAIIIIAFPFLLAIIKVFLPSSTEIFSILNAFFITFLLVFYSTAIAFLVWNIVRKARQLRVGSTLISKLLSEIGFPLLVVYTISLPLTSNVAGATTLYLFPKVPISVFFEHSALKVGIEIVWVAFSSLVMLSLGWLMLNNTKDFLNQKTYQFFSSRHFTFGSPAIHFIVAKIKRRMRYRPALAIQGFTMLFLFAFSVWTIYERAELTSVLLSSIALVAPYVGIIHPLFALYDDLSCEWVFKIAPLKRLNYLYLVLVSMSFLALLTTLFQVVVVAFLIGQRLTILEWWELSSKTLGFSGLAFITGGIFRSQLVDATGQLFMMIMFGIVVAATNFGLQLAVQSFPIIGIDLLWFMLFILSPILVNIWEFYSDKNL